MGGDSCDVRLSLKYGAELKPGLACANATVGLRGDSSSETDKERYCGFYSTDCTKFLDLTGPFVIGGLPPSKQQPSVVSGGNSEFPGSFVGCIRDLIIDQQPVNMHQVRKQGFVQNQYDSL